MSGMIRTPRSRRIRSASKVVGPLAPSADAGANLEGVVGGDLALQGGEDQDVAVQLERLGGRQLPCTGEPADRIRPAQVPLGNDIEAVLPVNKPSRSATATTRAPPSWQNRAV